LTKKPKTRRTKRFVYVGHNHHNDHHDENKCSVAKAWSYNLKIHENKKEKGDEMVSHEFPRETF
jgi:hypothetical protein